MNSRKPSHVDSMDFAQFPISLKALLDTPLPSQSADLKSLDTLVLDFETSGFDVDKDKVLSMGWVEIRNSQIRLTSARHIVLDQPVLREYDSVRIHHLRPETLRNFGVCEQEAFAQLFCAMKGKILVVHGSVMEKRFLQRYLTIHYGQASLPLIWLDTLKIEQYLEQFRQVRHDWRLSSVRTAHSLPEYQAHNALNDAIATAELYLAQIHRLFTHESAPLHIVAEISA
ncbi:3'-5' exonuclease [Salinivibrio costicola]|uniref:DNA polymerase III subunit epsilon n=1 Tax=Salinivibrio costicola subsp. alcaliphilus TaxID=272773 RepID=A0ABX3KNK4_SALCS|nr:3'-5' exonuclease [Salinivibrio costicola]OOF33151.1 DNA polymerase III subunit epsilon [Salinivibrio costicola subsp. alcaliphilus]